MLTSLQSEAFDTIIEQVKEDYTDNLTYDKTNSRSVLGPMNDIARCLPFLLERRGGIDGGSNFLHP